MPRLKPLNKKYKAHGGQLLLLPVREPSRDFGKFFSELREAACVEKLLEKVQAEPTSWVGCGLRIIRARRTVLARLMETQIGCMLCFPVG